MTWGCSTGRTHLSLPSRMRLLRLQVAAAARWHIGAVTEDAAGLTPFSTSLQAKPGAMPAFMCEEGENRCVAPGGAPTTCVSLPHG